MTECINEQADIFAIDLMPLKICKISGEQGNKMGKESGHHSPDKDYRTFTAHLTYINELLQAHLFQSY